MERKYKNVRDHRLHVEYEKIIELCAKSTKIEYKIIKETRSHGLPFVYEISYKVKSIIGIEWDDTPIFGNLHKLAIELPPTWPGANTPPSFYFITDTWHPNIQSGEPHKGHVCIDIKSIAGFEGLDDLIIRIGELLQYKNYLAEDRPPYPEDTKVAEWIREYAEPNGIVDFKKGIAVDSSDLIDIVEGPGSTKISVAEDVMSDWIEEISISDEDEINSKQQKDEDNEDDAIDIDISFD